MLTFHPPQQKAPSPPPPLRGRFCFLFLIFNPQTIGWFRSPCSWRAGSVFRGKGWERGEKRGPETPRNCWGGVAEGAGNLQGAADRSSRCHRVRSSAGRREPAAPSIVAPRLLPCWRESPLTSAPSARRAICRPRAAAPGRMRVLPVLAAGFPARPDVSRARRRGLPAPQLQASPRPRAPLPSPRATSAGPGVGGGGGGRRETGQEEGAGCAWGVWPSPRGCGKRARCRAGPRVVEPGCPGLLQPLTPARGPGPPSLWPDVPMNV